MRAVVLQKQTSNCTMTQLSCIQKIFIGQSNRPRSVYACQVHDLYCHEHVEIFHLFEHREWLSYGLIGRIGFEQDNLSSWCTHIIISASESKTMISKCYRRILCVQSWQMCLTTISKGKHTVDPFWYKWATSNEYYLTFVFMFVCLTKSIVYYCDLFLRIFERVFSGNCSTTDWDAINWAQS